MFHPTKRWVGYVASKLEYGKKLLFFPSTFYALPFRVSSFREHSFFHLKYLSPSLRESHGVKYLRDLEVMETNKTPRHTRRKDEKSSTRRNARAKE